MAWFPHATRKRRPRSMPRFDRETASSALLIGWRHGHSPQPRTIGGRAEFGGPVPSPGLGQQQRGFTPCRWTAVSRSGCGRTGGGLAPAHAPEKGRKSVVGGRPREHSHNQSTLGMSPASSLLPSTQLPRARETPSQPKLYLCRKWEDCTGRAAPLQRRVVLRCSAVTACGTAGHR